MSRRLDERRYRARYVIVVTLDTGAEVRFTGEWSRRYQIEMHEEGRQAVARLLPSKRMEWRRLGIADVSTALSIETETTETYIETYTSTTLVATYPAPEREDTPA